jgi:GTP-binding protein YchF
MECGIVGLPSSGKTTLFNALTGSHASGFSAGGGGGAGLKPNVGVAKIPDPRLPLIASLITTKKIVHATIQFVDIPGVPSGGGAGGAAKLNAFLAHARQVDAIVQVVRCFDDGTGKIAPAKDIDSMETDLVIADLSVIEGSLDKAQRTARTGEADAKARVAVLEKCNALLNEGKPIRSGGAGQWSDAERIVLKTYGLITAKPVLYVANVSEDDLQGKSPHAQAVIKHAETTGGQAVVVCAKLEAELAEIENDAERDEMLKSMGLQEAANGPLARAANRLLGLTTFYTAGDKEVRAWPARIGAHAPEAAGSIHSDIERGFIRAECYGVDDLVQHKSEKAIREAGKLRSEGKNYAIRDGDVVHFLFNV